MSKSLFWAVGKRIIILIIIAGVLAVSAPLFLWAGSTSSIFNVFASAHQIETWWPTEGATLSGTQPFKGMLTNKDVNDYVMYWQVDDGGKVVMDTNYQDYPHKEASVDLSGWNWRGAGPYKLTFSALDHAGNKLAEKIVNINVTGNTAPVTTDTNAVIATVTTEPSVSLTPGQQKKNSETEVVLVNVSNSNNPLSGSKFYVNPNSVAKDVDKISGQPVAKWLGGWSNIGNDVGGTVTAARNAGAVPTFVAYNIPQRDCGSYSAGGMGSADAYRNWINDIANNIGGNKAVVILEPDGLSQVTCLSGEDQNRRYDLLAGAVNTLKSKGNIAVYVDAGHSNWISPTEMASRLKRAGVDRADGFALNVSNFMRTGDEANYGKQISDQLGGKHFVIDTSRNGNGSNGEWCNPWGRALGERPTASTGNNLVDAYLWIKQPGESDGWCNGGPSAGTWWPAYAWDLANNTRW